MAGVYVWLGLLAGAGLLAANGAFVTIEYALTRLRQFPESDFTSGPLRAAWEMTEELEIYLSASKLGIAITSVGLGVVAEPALAAVLNPALVAAGLVAEPPHGGHTAVAATLAFAVITMLHVTVGEQAPTYLGVERPKTVARLVAPPQRAWTRVMGPVIRFGDRVAKAILAAAGVHVARSWVDAEAGEGDDAGDSLGDVRREVDAVLDDSDLSEERRREVLRAVVLEETPVEAVMVPWEEVTPLYDDEDLSAAASRVRDDPHTRYPLVAADLRGDERSTVPLSGVEGTVYTSALWREVDALRDGEADLAAVAVDPMTVPAGMAVSELVDRLQAAAQELALVVEDGAVVGLVTATDAFEAIAGELEDPTDVGETGGEPA